MKKLLLATTVILAGFALSTAAMAQATPPSAPPAETVPGATEPTNIPGHPRVNEVDQRDNNQEKRIQQGEADGQLSKGQAARDQNRLNHEEAQQQKQEAAHGGHLTKGELHHDNKEMNHSSRKIHRQRHEGARREHREHHHGGRHHK
jgi:hypothetical protein